jgi:hypothetical protein
MQLHHCAFKITAGSSKIVQEFSEYLGAELVWEGFDEGREIAMQFDHNFRIQFSEKNEKPVKSEFKQESHIGFRSEYPQKDIEKIETWFINNEIRVKRGYWSEKEQWIDCPDIFVDFVIEIFTPKNA